ncbi:MAG TPA: AmmeMemoRadiSam system protein A [Desulfobacteraceae bacterium]|nr:AmmeMemoRadiSam system protein A [Desulfobacteraceae bacterium]
MLTDEQGKILIRLARQVIEENLELEPTDPVSKQELTDPVFQEHKPLFVTLNKHGLLRGCIGCLVGTESIIEAIKRHAVNAAFFDQRFPPVTVDEVPELEINISLLTEPQPLEYRVGEDLEKKIRPGVDGVILRDPTMGAATFLPQVWEQLPTVPLFLDHLCGKAGLPEDTWRKRHLQIQTYQVQYFKE